MLRTILIGILDSEDGLEWAKSLQTVTRQRLGGSGLEVEENSLERKFWL